MPPSKEEKRLYDIEYRKKNRARLKAEKALYYKTPEGRATSKRNRVKMKTRHAEYIKKPSYKQWKKEYDLVSRWGEYKECWLLIDQIFEVVVKALPTSYERLKARGYDFNGKNRQRRLRKKLFKRLINLNSTTCTSKD